MQEQASRSSRRDFLLYLGILLEFIGLGLTVISATNLLPGAWGWPGVAIGGTLTVGAFTVLVVLLGRSLLAAIRAGVTYAVQDGMLHKIVRGRRMRNVAMSIPTIQGILENQGDPDALRELGRRMGEKFARTRFRRRFLGTQETEPGQLIKAWAEIDSTAGWGRFDDSELQVVNGTPVGTVRVIDHFLAEGRNGTEPNLCAFAAGYLKGVLATLTGVEEISVTEQKCGSTTVDDVCLFLVEQPLSPTVSC